VFIGVVMRLVLLFALGCGTEEEEREVSKDTYAAEYTEAICAVQVRCELFDDQESCVTSVLPQWEDKIDSGCFDEFAARDCLDILETLTCDGYFDDEWSICSDVDVCPED
jgi:hypothetical protein